MEFFWNKVLTIYPNSQGGFMKETYQELKYVVDNSMYVKINYNKIVEFAFRDTSKPMGVVTYKTYNDLPEAYKNILPDTETLKSLL